MDPNLFPSYGKIGLFQSQFVLRPIVATSLQQLVHVHVTQFWSVRCKEMSSKTFRKKYPLFQRNPKEEMVLLFLVCIVAVSLNVLHTPVAAVRRLREKLSAH